MLLAEPSCMAWLKGAEEQTWRHHYVINHSQEKKAFTEQEWMLARVCASCGWAVLWRFGGKPQEVSPKALRCAQGLLEGILNFVIPWKTSTAARGLLLMATITAPSLSNVKRLMSPINQWLELHQFWASRWISETKYMLGHQQGTKISGNQHWWKSVHGYT